MPRNAWGLCDMSGNVGEWIWDWYGSYTGAATTDPPGSASQVYRMFRGGHWNLDPQSVWIANRSIGNPGDRGHTLGFRLVRSDH